MDNTQMLAGIVLVDNRITELLKRALIARLNASDEVAGVVVLLVSFIVGFGAALLLPAVNLFAGQGSSSVAEFILTGIVIGALANGIDFMGKGVQSAFDRLAPPETTTVSQVATLTTSETVPAEKAA